MRFRESGRLDTSNVQDRRSGGGGMRGGRGLAVGGGGVGVVGLIVIPMIVYMFSFYMHFLILENSGPGDAQMSSLFQSHLRGGALLLHHLRTH